MKRFNILKDLAREKGVELEKLTLEEYDVLWNRAKELAAN
jgi:uncharacterized protein YabN with tetrapyrrole methylase and pyrophosphatase domain